MLLSRIFAPSLLSVSDLLAALKSERLFTVYMQCLGIPILIVGILGFVSSTVIYSVHYSVAIGLFY